MPPGEPSLARRLARSIWGAGLILWALTFLVGSISALVGVPLGFYIAALSLAFLVADLAQDSVFQVTPRYTKAWDDRRFATKGETFLAMAAFILIISTMISLAFSYLPPIFAIAFTPLDLGIWTQPVEAGVMATLTTFVIGADYSRRRRKAGI